MCITFNASDRELRIEFNVIACRGNDKNCIRATQKQLRTWSNGSGDGSPHLWIAKLEGTDSFFFWRHQEKAFADAFVERAGKQTTRRAVRVPRGALQSPLSLTRLFLSIMQYAVEEGFLK